jgi:hypothetical protein
VQKRAEYRRKGGKALSFVSQPHTETPHTRGVTCVKLMRCSHLLSLVLRHIVARDLGIVHLAVGVVASLDVLHSLLRQSTDACDHKRYRVACDRIRSRRVRRVRPASAMNDERQAGSGCALLMLPSIKQQRVHGGRGRQRAKDRTVI